MQSQGYTEMNSNQYYEKIDWASFSDGTAKQADRASRTSPGVHPTFSDPLEDKYEYKIGFRS
jgi:hypothetical protein